MPKIKFTKEDVLQRNQLDASWYKVAAKEVVEETAKDGVSTNWVTKFVILEGPQAGVPIRHWFNEKAMGRVVDYVKCFTAGKVDLEKEYELEDTVDRPVLAYCHYDQKMKFNVIDDFRPVSTGATAA